MLSSMRWRFSGIVSLIWFEVNSKMAREITGTLNLHHKLDVLWGRSKQHFCLIHEYGQGYGLCMKSEGILERSMREMRLPYLRCGKNFV